LSKKNNNKIRVRRSKCSFFKNKIFTHDTPNKMKKAFQKTKNKKKKKNEERKSKDISVNPILHSISSWQKP
jgi:hypothetical protein